MKLVINYDLMSRVKDAREKLGPLKIIRNRKVQYLSFNLPLWASLNYIFGHDFISNIYTLFLQYGIVIGTELIAQKMVGDAWMQRAVRSLIMLVPQLQSLCVHTDYYKLLEAETYKTKYKIKLNEKKLPQVLQSKYIMVPTYGFDGNETETSVLQEHVMGSRDYILSIGSPQKKKSLVFSRGKLAIGFNS